MEQQRDQAALDQHTQQLDLERQERERQRLVDSARYLEVSGPNPALTVSGLNTGAVGHRKYSGSKQAGISPADKNTRD